MLSDGFFVEWQKDLNYKKLLGNYLVPSKFVSDKDVICVDMGSARGYFPMTYGSVFDKFYCFEPCYPNFVQLLSNIIDRDLVHKVSAFNLAGVGKDMSRSMLPFEFNTTLSPYGSSLADLSSYDGRKNNSKHMVLGLSFNDILEFIGHDYVNYLKCDIEGFEYDLLYDQNLKNVGVIGIEIHSTILGNKKNVLIDYIKSQGFSLKGKPRNKTNTEYMFVNDNNEYDIEWNDE
jgi:FkbM family methyltransferase